MAYIGTSPSNGVRRVFDYTATAGQDTFQSTDNNGQSLVYTDSAYIDVYQNGILLLPSDYVATTGTTVVLDVAAALEDTVQIVAYDVFSVADTVSASDGGSFAGNVGVGGTLGVTGVPTFTGRSVHSGGVTVANDGQIGSVGDADAMAISSAGVVNFTQTPTYASTKDPFNSVIETWYYNNDTTTTYSNDDVLHDGYTRLTTNNTANKNGGMSHDTAAGTGGTGIWTFPSTGIWRIELLFNFYCSGGTSVASGVRMQVTTDNSNYVDVCGVRNNGYATNANAGITLPYTLNVNDVSNVKFKHVVNTLGNDIIIRGGSPSVDAFGTLINFIKLCPSV